jgi:alpha-L-fucosidase
VDSSPLDQLPSWEEASADYVCPEWFRDAKFGIWAHWGPQCQGAQGDHYAAGLYGPPNVETPYVTDDAIYRYHLHRYGHPSQVGFKDVIHDWKAEKWDPSALMALYKRAGAKYFYCLGNHHDNLDNWDSQHHEWNSVRVGPQRDLVGGWAVAAREVGLKFGVSLHAWQAPLYYAGARLADKGGPWKSVPYDGNLTKADGRGQWWEGLDPRLLYAVDQDLEAGPDADYATSARST